MKPTVLVADDSGSCAQEIGKALGRKGVSLARAKTLEECVDKARTLRPVVMVVYAGMSRGFSLLRLLRRSDDLASIPLIVVGDAEQEELIAKHRQLPTRADRYLLRPLDPELTRSVVAEFAGDAGQSAAEQADVVEASEEDEGPSLGAAPPPLPPPNQTVLSVTPGPPDAYKKIEEELKRYRDRVQELEHEVGMMMKSSVEASQLREENEKLKLELAQVMEAASAAAPTAEFDDLFVRLEQGYKETIEDLERLLHEKDELVAKLASGAELGTGEEASALAEKLEQEQKRSAELHKVVRLLSSLLGEADRAEEDMGVVRLLEKLKRLESVEAQLGNAFAFDEETLVVEAENTEPGLLPPK